MAVTLPGWLLDLHEMADAVNAADSALVDALGTDGEAEALAAYKAAKAAFRKFESEYVGAGYDDDCGRCGGAGGSDAWRGTGWTCYDCGGNGRMMRAYRKMRFPADPRTRAKRAAEHAAKVAEENAAYAKLAEALGEVGKAITEAEAMVESGEAYMADNSNEIYFRAGMAHKLRRFGSLSEAQIAAVQKGLDRDAAKAEAKAKADAAGPLVGGTRQLTGEILTVKWQSSQYGGALKMLVLLDEGHKVWGTCPQSLLTEDENGGSEYPAVGSRVTFTAQVERSDDDPAFGFFKRPKAASIIGEGVNS